MQQIDGVLDCIGHAALGIRRQAESMKNGGGLKDGIAFIQGQVIALNHMLDGLWADLDKEEREQAFPVYETDYPDFSKLRSASKFKNVHVGYIDERG